MTTSLQLNERQTADFEMIGNGGFAPLTGPQGSADWKSVVENMTLAAGDYWPIPITLATDLEASEGDTVELTSDEGKALGTLTVSEIFERDMEAEAEGVYLTADKEHPGVAAIFEEGARCIAGSYEVGALPDHEQAFMKRYLSPEESKQAFADRGWKRIVAFQTRNPIHRAHEYVTKAALEINDGLMIHPLIGKTKEGDISAEVRMRCYEVLMQDYYPEDRVILNVFPSKMHYAGPREAVLHAIARRNYGATHFIVGRDHAGVGDYYGTYDAQRIFDDLDIDKLGIQPLFFDHSFWCNKCEGMASGKTCPHDPDAHVFLSGTKVREMLDNGELPPPEFSRPEVAQILIDAYRND
ncbi:MAG: sulfate adenylyltransferase [Solirubrobacterales bacterium]|nr:sulfate adenylyltransferase [Solirubrobacterales bacterium]